MGEKFLRGARTAVVQRTARSGRANTPAQQGDRVTAVIYDCRYRARCYYGLRAFSHDGDQLPFDVLHHCTHAHAYAHDAP